MSPQISDSACSRHKGAIHNEHKKKYGLRQLMVDVMYVQMGWLGRWSISLYIRRIPSGIVLGRAKAFRRRYSSSGRCNVMPVKAVEEYMPVKSQISPVLWGCHIWDLQIMTAIQTQDDSCQEGSQLTTGFACTHHTNTTQSYDGFSLHPHIPESSSNAVRLTLQ